MTTKLNNLPPGYSSRAATWDDLQAVVTLANLDSKSSTGVEDTSLEEIRNDWDEPGFDLARDTQLVFSTENELVGFAEILKLQSPPVKPYLWISYLPEEPVEVGTFLLKWAKGSALNVSSLVPENASINLVAHNVSGYAPKQTVFEQNEMSVIRHSFQMRIDMEERPANPSWPEQIELRPFVENIHAQDVYRQMTTLSKIISAT